MRKGRSELLEDPERNCGHIPSSSQSSASFITGDCMREQVGVSIYKKNIFVLIRKCQLRFPELPGRDNISCAL